jgi:DNA-binding CsgD family transcriptional regulator
LTLRQCDILKGILDGLSNKAIGRRLGISHNTVRNYTSQIFKILNQPDRASLRRLFNGSHEPVNSGEPTGGYIEPASNPFLRFKTEGAERAQIFVVAVRPTDIANADFLNGAIMLIVGGMIIPAVHVNRAEFLQEIGGGFDLCLD